MIVSQKTYFNALFYVAMTMILMQYVRPQDILNIPIGFYTPLAALTMVLVIFSGRTSTLFCHSQFRIVLAFLLWVTLCVPFAYSQGAGLAGVQKFIQILPFFLAVIIMTDTIASLRRLIDGLMILTLIICIRAFFAHEGGGKGASFALGNFLSDPNDFTLFLNTMISIAFFMFISEKKIIWKKLVYISVVILSIILIIISFSRGGFVGLMFVALTIWWYSPNKKIITVVMAIVALIVLGLAAGEWMTAIQSSGDIETDGSIAGRLTMWNWSWSAFLDNPITGVGINNVPNSIYQYAEYGENAAIKYGVVNHSFWFTILAETGILGSLLVGGLIFHNFRDSMRMAKLKIQDEDTRFLKCLGAGLVGSMTGFLVSGTFVSVAYYPHLWYLSAIITVAGRMMYQLNRNQLQ